MAKDNDWLGGYTLQELLSAAPVSKSPKQLKQEKKAAKKASGERGLLSTIVGAPFRLVAGLVKLPIMLVSKLFSGVTRALTEIVKLPVRMVGALTSPFRKSHH